MLVLCKNWMFILSSFICVEVTGRLILIHLEDNSVIVGYPHPAINDFKLIIFFCFELLNITHLLSFTMEMTFIGPFLFSLSYF